jgi:hypothetical protein
MGFLDKIRNALAGPPRVQGGDDEGDAALHEDFGTPDEGDAEVKASEQLSGGAVVPGQAAAEAAESAEAEIEAEEGPPGS